MTPEQYERWQDFATRMAKTCFVQSRRPNRLWIEEVVADFFDGFPAADIVCVESWDNAHAYPEGHSFRRQGPHGQWDAPGGIGDHMAEFLATYEGYPPYCAVCATPGFAAECDCDQVDEMYHEQWQDQWGGPVRCCIRAGLDSANGPAAGVLGFTAGDIRRMYLAGVPDWVFPPGERLQHWPDGDLNGTFAELPDSSRIVL